MSTILGLIGKYEKAVEDIADAWGGVSLYGLFERSDNSGKFDIIISARYLKPNRNGLLLVAEYLPKLAPEDVTRIGRIVLIRPDEDFVREVTQRLPEVHGRPVELSAGDYGGVPIAKAYIFISSKTALDKGQAIAA